MAKTKTLVMKFGGTSVGSLEGLEQVVKIVCQATLDWQQVVVVFLRFFKSDGCIIGECQAGR